MAIAKNFLKFAEAMAVQFPLPLGKPVWNTKRPTTRRGRAYRAHIAAVVKAVGLRVEVVAKPIPQWWKDSQKRARAFEKATRADVVELDFRAAIQRPSLMRQIASMGMSAWA